MKHHAFIVSNIRGYVLHGYAHSYASIQTPDGTSHEVDLEGRIKEPSAFLARFLTQHPQHPERARATSIGALLRAAIEEDINGDGW